MAVGIVDLMAKGINSRAVYFDPAYNFLNLGIYAALVEIFFARRRKLPYHTMGVTQYRYISPQMDIFYNI